MSFSLRKDLLLKNNFNNLRKTMKPEHFKLLETRVGQLGAPIATWGQEFISILARWSFETNIRFCTEHGIFSTLEMSKTVRELLFDLNWKNQIMIQDLLDALVDQEILRKKKREYSPFAFSALLSKHELGIRDSDRRLIAKSKDYRTLFSFYNKLLSNYVLDSLISGEPATTLRGSNISQLGLIFDVLLKTSVYVIPRMSSLAAGITKCDPKTILHLNCSTGRGTEEILLCQPNAELVLGIDLIPYQVEIAKRNIDAHHVTHPFTAKVEFRTIDYSHPLIDQLSGVYEPFDMILIDQLPMWIPKEAHPSLIHEIWRLLRPDGVIVLNQTLRPSPTCPWPNEWILRTLDGFSGFPDASEFLKLFESHYTETTTRGSITTQTLIPFLTYLIYP